ncbi:MULTISPECIES: hypothetical protein [unclassified Pseudoalteromonas]|uniref:hypothetical protein n=1 Tax=unclassified Pseudoalteromonas TaxID=194690 RepID=UPI000D7030C4|nr:MULTISPECIES: hypothetical protein [unclassified Pseudoalteromonas]MDN3485465.1 hypothetical protein [Pseudoalteromonas sp. APC 3224]PWS56507.1 hypothetical protein DK924_07170 [Pseudoalteromonas sp. meg-B1]
MSVFDFTTILVFGLGSVVVMAYYITHLAESGINEQSKVKLTNIVKNYRATPTIRHSFITFTMVSDYLFGDKIFSLRAFLLSCFISLLWMTITLIICTFLFPTYTSWIGQANLSKVILLSSLPLVLAVLVIDFISVSITRLFIRKSKARGGFGLLFVLAIDFIIAATLFYVGITAFKYVVINPTWLSVTDSFPYWIQLDQMPVLLQTLNDLTPDMLSEKGSGNYDIKGGLYTEVVYAFPEGVSFYSSLLTSVWLWLHIFSYCLFKLTLQIDLLKNYLLKFVEIDKKPFTALAIMVAISYVIISIALIIAFSIYKWIYV